MKFVCLIILILLVPWKVYGQEAAGGEIRGRLQTVKDGSLLSGATVTVRSLADTQVVVRVVTGADGVFYAMHLRKGTYRLEISHVGYVAYTSPGIVVGEGVVLFPVRLKESGGSELKEIQIRGQQALVEQRLNKTIVHVDGLLSNAGANVLDVLNNVPGVEVGDDGALSLKGRTGVAVYIDGRASYLTGAELATYLRTLPVGMLDRIELMTNPPARYNAAGTAGIIDIRTKRGKAAGWNASINGAYSQGVYPKSSNSVTFNYKGGRVSVFGSVGYSAYNERFESNRLRSYAASSALPAYSLTQHYYEKSIKKGVPYQAEVDFTTVAGTMWGVVVGGLVSPYHERGHYGDQFYNAVGYGDSAIAVRSDLHSHLDNEHVNLNFRHRFFEKQEISADADFVTYHSGSKQVSDNYTYYPDSAGASNFERTTQQPFTVHLYGGKVDYSYQFSDKRSLEAGVQSLYTERESTADYLTRVNGALLSDAGLNNRFTYRERIQAAYASFSEKMRYFNVQAGLRLEYTDGKGVQSDRVDKPDSSFRLRYTNLFPEFSVSYQPDSAVMSQWVFSYSRRITRPDYESLNPSIFFFDQNTYNAGNPLLQPEFSSNFEFTYVYRRLLTVTLLYNNTKDNIVGVYEQSGKAFILQTINLDRATTVGVNATVTVPVTSWWTANLYGEWLVKGYKGSYVGAVAMDTSAGYVRVSGSSQVKLGHGWSTEVSGNYRTRYLYAQAVMRPMGQVHLAVQKKVLKGKGTIGVAARDIFHSWKLNRNILLQGAVIDLRNERDTRMVTVSFSYLLGKKGGGIVHKSGVQEEERRLGGVGH